MYNYNESNAGHHSGCSTSAPNYAQPGMTQPPYYQNTYYQNSYDDTPVFYHSPQLWKGVALGAITAIFITNESLQKAVMKGAIKLYDTIQSGAYELKEKFEDVQAEVRQKAGEEK